MKGRKYKLQYLFYFWWRNIFYINPHSIQINYPIYLEERKKTHIETRLRIEITTRNEQKKQQHSTVQTLITTVTYTERSISMNSNANCMLWKLNVLIAFQLWRHHLFFICLSVSLFFIMIFFSEFLLIKQFYVYTYFKKYNKHLNIENAIAKWFTETWGERESGQKYTTVNSIYLMLFLVENSIIPMFSFVFCFVLIFSRYKSKAMCACFFNLYYFSLSHTMYIYIIAYGLDRCDWIMEIWTSKYLYN